MSNLSKFKALQHIIKSAKFDVKGDAIIMMASSFSWFDNLEGLMKELDEKEKSKPDIKPTENGKANVDK